MTAQCTGPLNPCLRRLFRAGEKVLGVRKDYGYHMNENALPDDLKKKSILCSVRTTDIKTITFVGMEPALQRGENAEQNAPQSTVIGSDR